MDAGQRTSGPLTAGPDPIGASLRQASTLARGGDFRSARALLARSLEHADPVDRERLRALDLSLRLDPAGLWVLGLTGAALLGLGLATLLHG